MECSPKTPFATRHGTRRPTRHLSHATTLSMSLLARCRVTDTQRGDRIRPPMPARKATTDRPSPSGDSISGDPVTGFEALYAQAWADLARLRGTPAAAAWLLPEATPVLAYGAWQTARIATAALNPSEDEFQTRETPRRALPPERQRLLHWP